MCRYTVCRYAVCRYAEFHYAECRYAECHGALIVWVKISLRYTIELGHKLLSNPILQTRIKTRPSVHPP